MTLERKHRVQSKRMKEIENNSVLDELHARLLTQFSRSELGLGNYEEALNYAEQAKQLL